MLSLCTVIVIQFYLFLYIADAEGVAYFSLNEPEYDSNMAITDKDLSEFVSVHLFMPAFTPHKVPSTFLHLSIP